MISNNMVLNNLLGLITEIQLIHLFKKIILNKFALLEEWTKLA
jgi:hypothetical protein